MMAHPADQQREERADQLLLMGFATVDDLLQMSFGEWPPHGLKITGSNPQIVRITTLPPEKNKAAGDATIDYQPRIIRFNPIESNPCHVLGHEAVHILQGDYYSRLRTLFDEDHLPGGGYMGIVPRADSIVAECYGNAHEAQVREGVYDVNYYRSGKEVQAHIHELMMEYYQVMRKLPATPEELTKSWYHLGVTSDPQNKIFPISLSMYGDEALFGIHEVIKSLSSEQQTQHFIDSTLAELYADLIEMYGDEMGRERFGLGKNPLPDARRGQKQAGARLVGVNDLASFLWDQPIAGIYGKSHPANISGLFFNDDLSLAPVERYERRRLAMMRKIPFLCHSLADMNLQDTHTDGCLNALDRALNEYPQQFMIVPIDMSSERQLSFELPTTSLVAAFYWQRDDLPPYVSNCYSSVDLNCLNPDLFDLSEVRGDQISSAFRSALRRSAPGIAEKVVAFGSPPTEPGELRSYYKGVVESLGKEIRVPMVSLVFDLEQVVGRPISRRDGLTDELAESLMNPDNATPNLLTHREPPGCFSHTEFNVAAALHGPSHTFGRRYVLNERLREHDRRTEMNTKPNGAGKSRNSRSPRSE